MLDHELCQPTPYVIDAIESLRPPLKPQPLRIEDCTTPELRLEYIAQWLEAGGDARYGINGFDMRWWHNPEAECGTTCCIGGAARTWFGDAYTSLGLSNVAGYELFYPPDMINVEYVDYRNITPAWAARCIRKYQQTGTVDWEGTRNEP